MGKFLLLSGVIGMVAIPVLNAQARDPQRSVRRVVIFMLIFNLLYLLAVRYIYPHLA